MIDGEIEVEETRIREREWAGLVSQSGDSGDF